MPSLIWRQIPQRQNIIRNYISKVNRFTLSGLIASQRATAAAPTGLCQTASFVSLQWQCERVARTPDRGPSSSRPRKQRCTWIIRSHMLIALLFEYVFFSLFGCVVCFFLCVCVTRYCCFMVPTCFFCVVELQCVFGDCGCHIRVCACCYMAGGCVIFVYVCCCVMFWYVFMCEMRVVLRLDVCVIYVLVCDRLCRCCAVDVFHVSECVCMRVT